MSTLFKTESMIIASFFSGDAIKYVYVHETLSKNCLNIISFQDSNYVFFYKKHREYSEYRQLTQNE